MLKQRIITALLISVPLIAALFWLPVFLTLGLFAACMLIGAWEWAVFAQLRQPAGRIAYVIITAAVMAMFWRGLQTHPERLPALLQLVILWWLLALCWILFLPQRQSRWLAAPAGVLVLASAWISIGHVLVLGASWMLYLLLLVASADVGGFLFGRRFGRHKLAPHVSPGKTWEGVAGGVGLSLLVALAGAVWFAQPVFEFVSMSLVTMAFSVAGDLTESLFKRHVGLKDSGNILPGHGGMLDRLDSISAAAPVFLYGLAWLGVFTS